MTFQALKITKQLLICEGRAFARGEQQGQFQARQLQLCLNALFQSELFQYFKHWGLPQRLSIALHNLITYQKFTPFLSRYNSTYLPYLKGMTQGSHISVRNLNAAALLELLCTQAGIHPGEGTTMAIPPALSSNTESFLIHNMDLPYFFHSNQIVRKSTPDQGLSSLEVTLLPWIGCHTGINEAGVAITCNYGFYHSNHREQTRPVSLGIQEALRTCHSAQEAVNFFSQNKQWGSALISVLDAKGNLYAVETAPGCVQTRFLSNNLLIQTNHYQHTEMLTYNIPSNHCYSSKTIDTLQAKRVRESSETRFDRLYEMAGTKIQFHESDLMTYFSDHGQGNGDDNSVCRHGSYFETMASILIKPASRELRVAIGSPCNTGYETYYL